MLMLMLSNLASKFCLNMDILIMMRAISSVWGQFYMNMKVMLFPNLMISSVSLIWYPYILPMISSVSDQFCLLSREGLLSLLWWVIFSVSLQFFAFFNKPNATFNLFGLGLGFCVNGSKSHLGWWYYDLHRFDWGTCFIQSFISTQGPISFNILTHQICKYQFCLLFCKLLPPLLKRDASSCNRSWGWSCSNFETFQPSNLNFAQRKHLLQLSSNTSHHLIRR